MRPSRRANREHVSKHIDSILSALRTARRVTSSIAGHLGGACIVRVYCASALSATQTMQTSGMHLPPLSAREQAVLTEQGRQRAQQLLHISSSLHVRSQPLWCCSCRTLATVCGWAAS